MPAKRFDRRRVAQIQSENFQAMTPLREIRLRSIARRRIARKASRHNQMTAGAQHFDAGLIANFNTSSSEQRHATTKISKFGPFAKIQLRARRTKLIVEVVNLRIVL